MKLPTFLTAILPKSKKTHAAFLSLYMDAFHVAASFWEFGHDSRPDVLASVGATIPKDTWEDRSSTIDSLLGLLEEKTGITDVTNVILGLPPEYLTKTGEIHKDIRGHIKTLTTDLALKPLGFVPLPQAIIFKLKHDEGVPPSVILFGVNTHTVSVSVYKVGELVGIRDVDMGTNLTASIEDGLKSFTDVEVLPARILMYGSKPDLLEDLKSKLLKHQWTSRVNFLHFPKIETVSNEDIIQAVSLAGASELGSGMPDDTDASQEDSEKNQAAQAQSQSEENIQQDEDQTIKAEADVSADRVTENDSDNSEQKDDSPIAAIADNTPDQENIRKVVDEEVAEAQEVISEDFSVDQLNEQDDNVVMVNAESLGFKKDVDIIEESQRTEEAEIEDDSSDDSEYDPEEEARDASDKKNIFSSLATGIGSFSLPKFTGKVPVLAILGVMITGGLLFALYWFIPRVTLSIEVIPKQISTEKSITIDPEASSIDSEALRIPGKKLEKTVSGEKTVPVNGKKNIGDPAKGTVTIYNKSVSSRTLKKGSILTSGTLQFTLDSDVQIASASENIGSITFGKTDANITAAKIGASGNLPSGTEFEFKDISSGVAVARNEKALAGGNSKEITVVTRADYDSFVKLLSEELVENAKPQLAGTVESNDVLIDDTIKTTVTEKVFNQEIDEQANSLEGKLSVAITGIAYGKQEIFQLLSSYIEGSIPTGYKIDSEKTDVSVSNVELQKDGTITADVKFVASAMPSLDTGVILSQITGKSVDAASTYLKSLPGVGGIKMSNANLLIKTRMPINRKNITITITDFK